MASEYIASEETNFVLYNKAVIKLKKPKPRKFCSSRMLSHPKASLESSHLNGRSAQQDSVPQHPRSLHQAALPLQPDSSEKGPSPPFLIEFYSRTNGFTTKLILNPVHFPTGNSSIFLQPRAQRIKTAASPGCESGASYRLGRSPEQSAGAVQPRSMPPPAPCSADREGAGDRHLGSSVVSAVSLSSPPCCLGQTDIKTTVISCTQRRDTERTQVTQPQGAVRTRLPSTSMLCPWTLC